MGSSQFPMLTAELLSSYSEAALCNADELLVEASLLLDHGHFARAYFLAVASIEEAGKALLAFDAQNRNLSDSSVRTKLKRAMENHTFKIDYALGKWASSSSDQRKALMVAIDLIIHLKHGREPSMYSDLRVDPDRAQTPKEVVRAKASSDCVTLAENTIAYSRRHVAENAAPVFSAIEDKLFTMKSRQFQELLNTEDFWLYYISLIEGGNQDIAEAVVGYQDDHVKAGIPFRASE